MELVLPRPYSFPTFQEICDLIKGVFLNEADDDDSIITDLDEPHDKEPEGDDPAQDRGDGSIIAGGDDDEDPPEDEEDGAGDEDDVKKSDEREKLFQTKYQEALKLIKDRDPELYHALRDDAEPKSHIPNLEEADGLSQSEMMTTIVKEVSASVTAEMRKDRHAEKKKEAKKAWDKEAKNARNLITETQEALGLTNEQAKEAFAYAKDLDLDSPLKIASVAQTYMKNMAPSAPQTVKERVAEAKKQREDLRLSSQPKKTPADPKPRKKTKDQTILEEMRAIKPPDAMDLLDSNRNRKK